MTADHTGRARAREAEERLRADLRAIAAQHPEVLARAREVDADEVLAAAEREGARS